MKQARLAPTVRLVIPLAGLIQAIEMLDKLRTAALGKAAPMVARLPILWGVEFAAKGQLREFGPEAG